MIKIFKDIYQVNQLPLKFLVFALIVTLPLLNLFKGQTEKLYHELKKSNAESEAIHLKEWVLIKNHRIIFDQVYLPIKPYEFEGSYKKLVIGKFDRKHTIIDRYKTKYTENIFSNKIGQRLMEIGARDSSIAICLAIDSKGYVPWIGTLNNGLIHVPIAKDLKLSRRCAFWPKLRKSIDLNRRTYCDPITDKKYYIASAQVSLNKKKWGDIVILYDGADMHQFYAENINFTIIIIIKLSILMAIIAIVYSHWKQFFRGLSNLKALWNLK